LIITIIFHAVALLLFLFFGLKQPVPLPKDAGASIEFGWETDAGADIAVPETRPVSPPTTTPPVSQPEEPVEEEVITEETGDLAVPDEPEQRDETPDRTESSTPTTPAETQPEEEPEEEPEPTLDDRLSRALGSIGQGDGDGSGETSGSGDQGDPSGKEGKGVLGGGSGSWELGGRSMMPGFGTKITDTDEEGVVTLNIWVDRQGRVTRVQPNLLESNTTSQYLINLAKNDVLNNFRFNSDAGAAIEQKGKVRYVFQLK